MKFVTGTASAWLTGISMQSPVTKQMIRQTSHMREGERERESGRESEREREREREREQLCNLNTMHVREEMKAHEGMMKPR